MQPLARSPLRCEHGPVAPGSAGALEGASMGSTAREIFDLQTRAFNDHDIETFATTLDEGVVQVAPGDMIARGRLACVEFFGSWIEAFPDAHVEVTAVHEAGDVIVEEGIFNGTQNGVFHTPAGDVPPTGRKVRGEYIQVITFRNGKCIAANLMFDRLQLLEQLGLVPAPATSG
jgi:predicted ester cyclase